eukprot:4904830-Pleurochrysis_carterae.AAC.3
MHSRARAIPFLHGLGYRETEKLVFCSGSSCGATVRTAYQKHFETGYMLPSQGVMPCSCGASWLLTDAWNGPEHNSHHSHPQFLTIQATL